MGRRSKLGAKARRFLKRDVYAVCREYEILMGRMRRKMKKGNRRLAIYSLFVRAECGLAFAVGASASYFGFIIVIPLVLNTLLR